MYYSIIDTNKGVNAGFRKDLHRLCDNGSKMVVNENELLLIDSNITNACNKLGGILMTETELFQKLKRDK